MSQRLARCLAFGTSSSSFADEGWLAIYRRIAEDATDYLKDGGKIYLEVDTSKVKVFLNF